MFKNGLFGQCNTTKFILTNFFKNFFKKFLEIFFEKKYMSKEFTYCGPGGCSRPPRTPPHFNYQYPYVCSALCVLRLA